MSFHSGPNILRHLSFIHESTRLLEARCLALGHTASEGHSCVIPQPGASQAGLFSFQICSWWTALPTEALQSPGGWQGGRDGAGVNASAAGRWGSDFQDRAPHLLLTPPLSHVMPQHCGTRAAPCDGHPIATDSMLGKEHTAPLIYSFSQETAPRLIIQEHKIK